MVPQRKPRQPRENIPQTREEREMILREVRHYVAEQTLVPPVPLEDLKQHADKLVAALGSKEIYRDCLLYTSPSPRDRQKSRMPSSA